MPIRDDLAVDEELPAVAIVADSTRHDALALRTKLAGSVAVRATRAHQFASSSLVGFFGLSLLSRFFFIAPIAAEVSAARAVFAIEPSG